MADSLEQLRLALADRYAVGREIGHGGMATVFLAHDIKHDRDIALKVFRPEVAALIGTERFFREIRIAAKLNHPHILPLHDSGQADGLLYYVMPYVEGESLRQRLRGERQLSVPEALRITRQVAAALDHAHRQGIVHRDVKPENILLHEDEALVTDFGIALAVHAAASERLTQTGLFIGTPAYVSPEQATGDHRLDGRSDVFSLGCVLHEMLAGEPPFTGDSAQAIVAQLLTERAPDVRSTRDNVAPHVAAAVRKALAKVPADRFATAGDFARALDSPARDAPRVSRRLLIAGAGTAALALAAVAWLATRDDAAPPPAAGADRLTLLMSSEGTTAYPALSPDGKLLAYVAGDGSDPHVDLYVRLVAGGQPVRLTSDAAAEAYPAFSPDGERIAFMRVDERAGPPAVWVVPALGGDAAPLVQRAGFPAWSPAGDELAVVLGVNDSRERIARVGLDGAVRRVVFENRDEYIGIRRLSWSPDGTTLAFARSRGGSTSELWIVPAEGGHASRLLTEPAPVVSRDPTFTPDGRAIVYSSSRGGAMNLWRIPLAGGDPVQLTSGSGPDAWPGISQSGSIVYLNSRWRNALLTYDLRSPGSEPRTLLTHTPYLWGPAFSPDGREIAFSRGEVDGAWSNWIVSVDGGAPRRLTSGPAPTIYPRFTPDGRWVIYFAWTAPSRIWRVPRAGGPAEALTPPGTDAAYGDVSPDGASLVFARTEAGTTRLYVAPLGAGRAGIARQLSAEAGTLPRWSPDGRWIAFALDRGYTGGIFVIGADGSGKRRVTATGGWPTWWPDGEGIGYLTVGPDGAQRANFTSLDGRITRDLGVRYGATNTPFDVSPDGRMLGTTNAIHLADEIWLLQGAR